MKGLPVIALAAQFDNGDAPGDIPVHHALGDLHQSFLHQPVYDHAWGRYLHLPLNVGDACLLGVRDESVDHRLLLRQGCNIIGVRVRHGRDPALAFHLEGGGEGCLHHLSGGTEIILRHPLPEFQLGMAQYGFGVKHHDYLPGFHSECRGLGMERLHDAGVTTALGERHKDTAPTLTCGCRASGTS